MLQYQCGGNIFTIYPITVLPQPKFMKMKFNGEIIIHQVNCDQFTFKYWQLLIYHLRSTMKGNRFTAVGPSSVHWGGRGVPIPWCIGTGREEDHPISLWKGSSGKGVPQEEPLTALPTQSMPGMGSPCPSISLLERRNNKGWAMVNIAL